MLFLILTLMPMTLDLEGSDPRTRPQRITGHCRHTLATQKPLGGGQPENWQMLNVQVSRGSTVEQRSKGAPFRTQSRYSITWTARARSRA